MQVTVSFKHMDTSDYLRDFIEEKSQILTKYFQGKIAVEWNITNERQNRIAHCHLKGNHMDYFGEATTEDYKASIEFALDKVEKQLRKHKEILKDHHNMV